MVKALRNAFKIPELKKRIIFTALLLIVYRVGAHITLPGVDDKALEVFFENLAGRFGKAGSNVIGFINLFSGGAFKQMTIFALGIQPYISASIAMQLLTVVIPSLEKLSKEDGGRKKIVQYTRYGTVILSIVQGVGISTMLRNPAAIGSDQPVVLNPTLGWTLLVMITLMAGTAFVMWLGEQITEHGIGQGISMIITVGIVSGLVPGAFRLVSSLIEGTLKIPALVLFLGLIVVAIMGTVFIQLAVRKIPVQYARRIVGRKVYGGQTTHIPLRVNTAGMIPIIFAVTLMQFPPTMLGFLPSSWKWIQSAQSLFSSSNPFYVLMYASLIVGFTYFYTAVQVNPVEMAENLRKYGGFIPGVRPGNNTAEYINSTLTRITLPGALFLAGIAVIPMIFEGVLKIGTMVSGASLLIVVGVVLDTVSQIESYLTTRHYEGFLKNQRVKGRRRR
ncbi:TPA: preprotein translocase subunit SecY [Candidatus Poribacteria bacterium]|nr:preprotein translocase subunit SecY [Candidatus Poribacteria bacterium]HIA69786.1 preprotein translocase subunit SecY [Candidatus Poribacteria bacterium]HIO47169.1 preprotein translocase subunit SecY [Candidatus Poribacteria bacterium]